jgi:hypothetical protein
MSDKQKFQASVRSRFKFGLFLLKDLPAAWFMGVHVLSLDDICAKVGLPYGWSSKNPFKSTYFAAQAAAAELSTGILILNHIQDKAPISMLVVSLEGKFMKKANQKLTFTCQQGQEVSDCIDLLLLKEEGEELVLTSVGTLPNGDIASEFAIKWSLRKKSVKA